MSEEITEIRVDDFEAEFETDGSFTLFHFHKDTEDYHYCAPQDEKNGVYKCRIEACGKEVPQGLVAHVKTKGLGSL